MSRLVLASFASALLGAVMGGGAVAWLAPRAPLEVSRGAADVNAAGGHGPVDSVDLARRLAAVERALVGLEARARVREGVSREPSASAPAAGAPHPVDTPVFEAAVMDIMDRAAEGRAEERAAAKDEKRRQKAEHWANELSMQLGLSPAQAEALLDIQAELDEVLERERVRSNAADAPYASKEQRRAARDGARQAAEGKLRALLAPPQLATYDGLDERLKLYRPKAAD